mmetsp:Transcript_32053/g.102146  ORF Transcript_32053/g.102146 Transcript_32053/m.102146 type:complete len:277 (+) Transcript_32053:134-964(+)
MPSAASAGRPKTRSRTPTLAKRLKASPDAVPSARSTHAKSLARSGHRRPDSARMRLASSLTVGSSTHICARSAALSRSSLLPMPWCRPSRFSRFSKPAPATAPKMQMEPKPAAIDQTKPVGVRSLASDAGAAIDGSAARVRRRVADGHADRRWAGMRPGAPRKSEAASAEPVCSSIFWTTSSPISPVGTDMMKTKRRLAAVRRLRPGTAAARAAQLSVLHAGTGGGGASYASGGNSRTARQEPAARLFSTSISRQVCAPTSARSAMKVTRSSSHRW